MPVPGISALFCEMKQGPDFFEKSEPISHFYEAEKRERTAELLNAIQERLLGRVGLHSKSRAIKSVFSAFRKLCHAAVDNLFLTLPNHDLVKILLYRKQPRRLPDKRSDLLHIDPGGNPFQSLVAILILQ